MTLHDLIGQHVLYFDYQRFNPMQPRAAVITGPGTEPQKVNLQVFNDHQVDMLDGAKVHEIETEPNVLLVEKAPDKTGGWERICCFAPEWCRPMPRNIHDEPAGEAAAKPRQQASRPPRARGGQVAAPA